MTLDNHKYISWRAENKLWEIMKWIFRLALFEVEVVPEEPPGWYSNPRGESVNAMNHEIMDWRTSYVSSFLNYGVKLRMVD